MRIIEYASNLHGRTLLEIASSTTWVVLIYRYIQVINLIPLSQGYTPAKASEELGTKLCNCLSTFVRGSPAPKDCDTAVDHHYLNGETRGEHRAASPSAQSGAIPPPSFHLGAVRITVPRQVFDAEGGSNRIREWCN
jgi:hypothetical protein